MGRGGHGQSSPNGRRDRNGFQKQDFRDRSFSGERESVRGAEEEEEEERQSLSRGSRWSAAERGKAAGGKLGFGPVTGQMGRARERERKLTGGVTAEKGRRRKREGLERKVSEKGKFSFLFSDFYSFQPFSFVILFLIDLYLHLGIYILYKCRNSYAMP